MAHGPQGPQIVPTALRLKPPPVLQTDCRIRRFGPLVDATPHSHSRCGSRTAPLHRFISNSGRILYDLPVFNDISGEADLADFAIETCGFAFNWNEELPR